jgi:hypothetical protein
MQRFVARLDSGRKLEPSGNVVLHGAGQSPEAFRSYYAAVGGNKPLLYMSYVSFQDDLPAYFATLRDELRSYTSSSLIPQIGLYMNGGGLDEHPVPPYDEAVAAGLYDTQIAELCAGLKSLACPVFLRIGFEFNGPWNGYRPESFKRAWIRIVEALRREGLDEVATVWCYCPLPSRREQPWGVDRDYEAFYPGDDVVDWWSIDLFEVADFYIDNTRWFMEDATQRQFPVMIGEATPRKVGVNEGETAWQKWFRPFFDFIYSQPTVKAFCYINWNWTQYPQFHDWGDARIEANETVLRYYQAELANEWYRHAEGE